MAHGQFAGGNGTVQRPYLIEDADDFYMMRKDPYAHYRLVSNIDIKQCSYLTTGGWPAFMFRGVLDGAGYGLSDLKMNSSMYGGIFTILRGTVRNLQMINFDIRTTSNSSQNYAGALAHTIELTEEHVVENCIVVGGYIEGTAIGSFAGNLSRGVIKNSFSTATLRPAVNNSAYYVGGLFSQSRPLSFLERPVIKNCYYSGEIVNIGTNIRQGGIIGYWTSAIIITDSFFRSDNYHSVNYGGTALSEEEMANPEHFSRWEPLMANHLQKLWSIAPGQLPTLYYNAGSMFMVYASGKYYKLTGNTSWEEFSESLPAEEEFLTHGIPEKTLTGVSGYTWNLLRHHGQIELVNFRERYRIDPIYESQALVAKEQVADGYLLSTKINLDDLGDSLNRVYLER